MPFIDWDIGRARTVYSNMFLDCIQDNSLEQLVNEPTRFRFGQNPSLLDLLITSPPDSINHFQVVEPFGKSDHAAIKFNVKNGSDQEIEPKNSYNYDDIEESLFLEKLGENNWMDLFENCDDLNTAYDLFVGAVNDAICVSVPLQSNQSRVRKHRGQQIKLKS